MGPSALGGTLAAGAALIWLSGCDGSNAIQPKTRGAAAIAKAEPRSSCDFRGGTERPNKPVTVLEGCPLYLPSPDGTLELRSRDLATLETELFVVDRDGSSPRRVGVYETPTALLWSPGSNSIMINDQKGSGQSSYLEIAHVEADRVFRSLSAQRNLSAMFKRMFGCAFDDQYVYSTGEGWLDRTTLIVDVQASHHSEGCLLDPYSANKLTLLVDAPSGKVVARKLPRP